MNVEQIVILLRKRGFNYYTDYAETYLERAFSPYGYYLTFRPEQQEWQCSLQYEGCEQLVFRAPWLEQLNASQLDALCAFLAKSFHTTARIVSEDAVPLNEDLPQTITYGFSSQAGAFFEPPFITEGSPVLRVITHDLLEFWSEETPVVVSYQNYGGPAKGLTVHFALPEDVSVKTMELCSEWDPRLRKQNEAKTKSMVTVPQIVTSNGQHEYLYEFPDFEIPEGINRFSRKLRGRKAAEEAACRRFWLRIFFSKQPSPGTVKLSVCPIAWNDPFTIIL